jgi:TonB family protein
VFSLLAYLPTARGGSFQSKAVVNTSRTTTRTAKGSTVEITTYNEVPEATEPCTAEESEWWKQLRAASNDLLKRGDDKSKRRFALLLYEGQQKAYHVPLKDRPPKVLARARVAHSELVGKKKINGTVALSIEYRADGSVGEVRLTEGVGFGMDENVIRAAKEALFLPAIKDGAFVTNWQNSEIEFSSQHH